jgi:CheY-like chemotaxis protein
MTPQEASREDRTSAARPGGEGDRPVSVLVVDDAPADRRLAGAIIERELGWDVAYADNGRAALAAVGHEEPHLVLTDLMMPEMGGLELVAALRRTHPRVAVVLMTVYGNEEVAVRALREGAASYVPKRLLDRDLVPTLEQVRAAAQAGHRQERLLGRLGRAELNFTLDYDTALIPALVAHLQQYLAPLGVCDLTGQTRVGVALEEALLNAVYHGNLEMSSDLRRLGDGPHRRLADERRGQAPFRDRRVHCAARFAPGEAVYVIRDEGPGFDPAAVPDPTDPANLDRASGRGLLLIRTFMDDVTFNDAANQITLVKRREPLASGGS